MTFSSLLILVISVATYNCKKNPLSPLQMQQVLQMISGVNNNLACNLSSVNPALLLSQGFNKKSIMAELSQVASLVYNQAYEECRNLDLSSTQCFDDCIAYNHPITLFRDTSSPSFYPSLTYILELYTVSASPIGWYDVGNPDQCDYFGGKYCYTPFISPQMRMPHGCCVPASCAGMDAIKVVTHNAWCFKAFNATYSQLFKQMKTDASIMTVCDIPARDMTSFGFIFAVLILSVFVLLVLIASCCYQYILQYKSQNIVVKDAMLNANLNEEQHNNESSALHAVQTNRFLNIFSIQCIWTKFTSYRAADKSSLNFLDGIRVYSMSWVILGHSYIYLFASNGSNTMSLVPMMPNAPNSTQHTYLVNRFANIFIQYAFYSVDTFFWLSGFLATFSIYRNVQKLSDSDRKWYKWIPIAYITRYLRIVPMMMFATLIQWKISDQLPGGAHVMSRDIHNKACSANWWKILFLGANLWLTRDNSDALSCMGHLWYVQVDFQCYILLPLLIVIFVWNKKAGIISSLIPTFTCIAIRFYFAFYYHFGANFLMPPAVKHGGNEGNQSYFKPLPRMSSYFVGVTLMFVMITINEWYTKHKKSRFILYQWSYFVIMAVSLSIFVCVLIWPYADVKHAPEERWNLSSNQIYYALARTSWAVALSLLAFALRYVDDRKQQTSLIKHLLSFNMYQSIAKLTYVMYLIHMIVFDWWSDDSIMPSYYNRWFIVLLFVGIWVVTANISLLLHLFMESPINSIISMFIKAIRKCHCCCCYKKRNQLQDDTNTAAVQTMQQYNQFTNEMTTFSIVETGNIE